MLLFVLLLLGLRGSEGWYNVQCSEGPENEVTVNKSSDGVNARYIVRYCTVPTPPPVRWKLIMDTLDQPPDQCTYDNLQEKFAGQSHSESLEEINSTSVNTSCPYVCFSKVMDLLHESCYRLSNQVIRQGKRWTISPEPHNTYQYISNGIKPYTKEAISQFVDCSDITEEQVVCTWLEGQIPFTDYEVMLMPNSTNEEWEVVTRNCTRVGGAAGAVRCELRVRAGGWLLLLRHVAPWTKGFNRLVVHHHAFTHSAGVGPAVVREGGATLVWAGAAGALLGGSLLAGLIVYRQRRAAKIKLRVLQQWLTTTTTTTNTTSKTERECGESETGRVLLLYARDCPAARRVAAALAAALNQQHRGQVIDLYSAGTVAACAVSPGAFVRECMSRADVRVVLLQTPALAALHALRTNGADPLQLEEPLLGGAVVYRAPVFGDTLLQYALQLLGEGAPAAPPHQPVYRKYFLATISGLAVDVYPSIVPYTRFELPAALPALVRALWPPPPPPLAPPAAPTAPTAPPAREPGQRELEAASAELVEFVREHPDYLEDYLMFMDA